MTGVRSLTITKEKRTIDWNQTYIDSKVVSRYISGEKVVLKPNRMGKIGKIKLASGPCKETNLETISTYEEIYAVALAFILMAYTFL
jgi:hypothetical protein